MRALLTAAFLAAGFSGVADAAIVGTYDSKASFDAAVRLSALEDFSSFSSEDSFSNTALKVGELSLFSTGQPSEFSGFLHNRIDIPPTNDTFNADELDGNFANVGLGAGDAFTITSAVPIIAFGAMIDSINDTFQRTQVTLDSGDSPGLSSANPAGKLIFFGFLSDTPFTSVTFSANFGQPDFFGIDNVQTVSAPTTVPIPASFLQLIAGFGILGLLGRCRRKFA